MPEDEGVDVGNPAGFAAEQIRSGTSANAALNAYRQAGGAIRRQTWFRLYAQTADTLARSAEASSLEPGAIPNAEQYGTWSMGPGGQYATQVNILFRDRDSGVVGTAPYTYVSNDPHTPDEAIAAGIDLYTDDEAAQKYDQQILGGVATGIWQTVPFGSV